MALYSHPAINNERPLAVSHGAVVGPLPGPREDLGPVPGEGGAGPTSERSSTETTRGEIIRTVFSRNGGWGRTRCWQAGNAGAEGGGTRFGGMVKSEAACLPLAIYKRAVLQKKVKMGGNVWKSTGKHPRKKRKYT